MISTTDTIFPDGKASGKILQTPGKFLRTSGKILQTSGKFLQPSGKWWQTSGEWWQPSGKSLQPSVKSLRSKSGRSSRHKVDGVWTWTELSGHHCPDPALVRISSGFSGKTSVCLVFELCQKIFVRCLPIRFLHSCKISSNFFQFIFTTLFF